MDKNFVLLDKYFLKQLDEWNEKEVYIKIISLDFAENPRSEIEGYATGGSIKVDGSSAVRRVCSLNMIANNASVNDSDWALESKFKVEVGLRNFINKNYDDIIWFPLGVYIISSFAMTSNAQGFSVSIQGRDKMCLLDGSVGGNIFASHDFGKLEIRKNDEMTELQDILIYDIIKNAIHEYALEPYENIIINDLEDCSVELLDYKVKNKQLMIYKVVLDSSIDQTDSGMAFEGHKVFEALKDVVDGTRVEVDGRVYERVKQVAYGDTVGYRLTDLTYAGDLILGAGSTITQMLDAIVKMLGEFEYFYDLYGRFVFQRKKIYYNVNWTNAVTNEKETRYDSVENGSENAYEFTKGLLIESYNNKPNLTNIKNDFTIWGKNLKDYPIHLRCAIDDKPVYYRPLVNKDKGELWGTSPIIFTEKGEELEVDIVCDWRELIYQMGLDYLQSDSKIAQLTKEIAGSLDDDSLEAKKKELIQWENAWKTGYVPYYTDIVDFWRILYDIDNWGQNYHWNPDYIKCIRNFNYIKVENGKGEYIYDEELKTWIEKDGGNYNRDLENYTDSIHFINHKNFIFWFDFLEDSYLDKYKVSNIGRRPKVVNDTEISAIFFEDTPNVLFVDPNNTTPQTETSLSYTRLNLIGGLSNYVQISTQGKSAKEALDNLIYTHTYYQESITLNCIPIYYLEPNVRISVYDTNSGINGEYIIKSYNLQLTYNGSMSITATRAEDLIL